MLHLTPRELPGQRVLSARIEVDPPAGRITEGTDHFGNNVSWMFLDRPHDRFRLTVQAEVEVAFPLAPLAEATPAWEEVAAASANGGGQDWRAAEFIFESPMVRADPAARDYAAQSFRAGQPVLAGLLDLTRRISGDFTFRAGVTEVQTPVARVMGLRAGVCQDFAHVMIAGLRQLGLPARYVSGYLRTRPPPGKKARRGVDQSHAWVGCWLGPALGWVDLDPTNNLVVHDEHVVLAWGRDYGDISPVRGVLLGGGDHRVSVAVDLEPA
jgi:transglutaminase-like putative cysteine protease